MYITFFINFVHMICLPVRFYNNEEVSIDDSCKRNVQNATPDKLK